VSETGLTADATAPLQQRPPRRLLSLRSVQAALSVVNPLSLLFGPIFQKEVRTAGRKRAGYIGRALYALALLAVVGFAFWAIWKQLAFTTSTVHRLQQMQEMAPVLALTIVWFQFVMLGLMGPNLTAPSIADEKRTGALAALLTTPMTAAQIIGGKLSGRLVHVLVLALLATPLLLAVRIFGGLEASIVLQATAIAVSTAILGAALGLLFSIWNKRSTAAAVFGLLTLGLFQSAIPATDGMLALWFEDRGYTFHQDTLAASSPATLAFLTAGAIRGMPPPHVSLTLVTPSATSPGRVIDLGPMWLFNTVYTLALALIISCIASAALRRTMLREASSGGEAHSPAAMAPPTRPVVPGATGAAGEETVRAKIATSSRDRTVGDNPVLWREVRQPTFGSRRRFVIASGVAAAGLAFLYWKFGFEEEGLHGSITVVGAIAIMLQSVFMTTGGFVGEREGRTWDVLLTTPLTAAEVALGKFAGSLRSQWFLPTLALGHVALSGTLGYLHPVLLLQLVLIFGGPILLFSATGLLFSLVFRKSTPASVANLIFALLFWLVPWLALALLAFVFEGSGFGPSHSAFDTIADTLYSFNPVAMTVSAFQAAVERGLGRPLRALQYDLASTDNLTVRGFTGIAVGVFAAYATAAGAVFWLTIATFKRWSGRTS
jgi:ABC-type transport system involved in multi-copper enzyme maturation permease subunit